MVSRADRRGRRKASAQRPANHSSTSCPVRWDLWRASWAFRRYRVWPVTLSDGLRHRGGVMTQLAGRPAATPTPASQPTPAQPAAVHRAGDGQHHRRRHLQPALRHRVVRADQPGRDGARDRRRRRPGASCSRCCPDGSPPTGGPYAYARAAFGNGFGFSQAWLYWITAWAGNAAIAVGWVFYVQKFLNKGGSTARLHRDRPGRALDPGRREPDRGAQHGRLPAVDAPC